MAQPIDLRPLYLASSPSFPSSTTSPCLRPIFCSALLRSWRFGEAVFGDDDIRPFPIRCFEHLPPFLSREFGITLRVPVAHFTSFGSDHSCTRFLASGPVSEGASSLHSAAMAGNGAASISRVTSPNQPLGKPTMSGKISGKQEEENQR